MHLSFSMSIQNILVYWGSLVPTPYNQSIDMIDLKMDVMVPDQSGANPSIRLASIDFTSGLYLVSLNRELVSAAVYDPEKPVIMDGRLNIEIRPKLDTLHLYSDTELTDKIAELSLVGSDNRPRR